MIYFLFRLTGTVTVTPSGSLLPFRFAILRRISCPRFPLPLAINHRGDSGKMLNKKIIFINIDPNNIKDCNSLFLRKMLLGLQGYVLINA